ncbi:MAG: efflux RND transporter periplasmic adaptor subunit [Treponema sp.]|nr:efflux RND transporter periplasmic adaptor subunit [Treponema sp.]
MNYQKTTNVFPGLSLFRLGGLLLVFFAVLLAGCKNSKNAPVYEFTNVKRGTLEKTVTSTGTLNPVATVKVIPQMSGRVEKINTDYNALVKKGEILAQLNTDDLKLKREQQQASVTKARANYQLQLLNYQNQQKLAEKNLIAEYDLKASKTTLDSQAADLAAAEANLKSIDLQINQYAYITSPIDGIVLARNVNIGDTVVDSSSSNSVAMFNLAESLKAMQVESWVGELDISSIKEGQDVRFTLESMPGRTFQGKVQSKRLSPSVQDNVVSYSVIVSVDNQDGSLLPGMSCTLDFIEQHKENILIAPNAALRYQPTYLTAAQAEDIVFNAGLRSMTDAQKTQAIQQREDAKKAAAASAANRNNQTGLAGLMSGVRMRPQQQRGPGQGQGNGQRNNGAANLGPPRTLWVIDANGKPDVIMVHTGISDGTNTEVIPMQGQDNPEGKQIVLRERVQ